VPAWAGKALGTGREDVVALIVFYGTSSAT
jgi:hypothetical protein